MTRVDVLVVGAGPAGSIAAFVLARAGLRVRLIDRARFPRDKLCGDTVNPGSLAMLDRIGSSRTPSLGDRVRARGLAITGMTVTGPRRASVSGEYPGGLRAAAIARRHLDLLLVEAAVEAGAAFDEGVAALAPVFSGDGRVAGVRVRTERGERAVDATVVIASDGRASRLASALGLARFAGGTRRWACGAYFGGVEGLTSHGEMHIRANGYIGIAPLPGGIANVCVVRDVRRGIDTTAFDQQQVIGDAVSGNPGLRDRFARATQLTPVSVLGPLGVDASAAGRPGLLLAGDACGFIDPMTGDGLRFALRGGELAASAAMREIDTNAPASGWLHRARRQEFSAKWRVNRALRSLVSSPRAVALAAACSRRWTAPVEYLIGVAGDIGLAGGRT